MTAQLEIPPVVPAGDRSIRTEYRQLQLARPTRGQRLSHLIREAGLPGAHWPPVDYDIPEAIRDEGPEPTTIEDIIVNSELSGAPIDERNAVAIGTLAAVQSYNLYSSHGLTVWRLNPHFGMLNALGATLLSGLEPTENAIKCSADIQQECLGGSAVYSFEAYFAPPQPVVTISHIKESVRALSTQSLKESAINIIRFLMIPLDEISCDLPPGPALLAASEQNPALLPTVDAYKYILDQVNATKRDALRSNRTIKPFMDQILAGRTRQASQAGSA